MIFVHKKRVYGYECDVYGHMNNSNYLQLMESARAEALIAMDMSISRLKELDLQIFIRHFELDYIKAVELEDTVTVRSWFHEMNRLKATWKQEIVNSRDEVCFTASMLGVFARGGKAQRLPQDVYDHFLCFLET